MSRKFSQRDLAIAEAVHNGASLGDVAKQFGVTPPTARRICLAQGVRWDVPETLAPAKRRGPRLGGRPTTTWIGIDAWLKARDDAKKR